MSRAHSQLGASSAHRWMACPGSFQVSQAVTEPATPSVYAAQGTIAHMLAEHLLEEGGPPDRYLGQTYVMDGHSIEVDTGMVEAVEIYLNAVAPIIAQSDFHITEQTIDLAFYWFPEKPPVRLFGTTDLLAYCRQTRRLTIVDYKHGAGVYVSHIDNPQALYYSAGALAMLENFIAGVEVADIEMIIVQPRVPGHEPVRSTVLPAIDVLLWVETELKPAVAATQQAGAKLVMGDHCRFCPGRVICPAMQSLRLKAAQRAFGPVAEDVSNATDADLAAFLDDIERIEVWADACRDEARDRIEQGARLPGWGLVPTRPRRVWEDEGAVAQLLRSWGFEAQDVYEYTLRSPAQMQKHLKFSPRQAAALQPLVDVRSSGTKLARVVKPTQQFDRTVDNAEPEEP